VPSARPPDGSRKDERWPWAAGFFFLRGTLQAKTPQRRGQGQRTRRRLREPGKGGEKDKTPGGRLVR